MGFDDSGAIDRRLGCRAVMTLSEHDGTEIVSVSLTKWEAESLIAAITVWFVDGPRDEHREQTLQGIAMALHSQIKDWH